MVTRALRCLAVACGIVAAISCGRDPAIVRDEHLAQGDALFQDGRFPQATVEYQKAVTADPKSSDARQRLAEAYVRVNMVEFAVKEYSNAAALSPARADLQMQAASLLLAAGRFEEAEVFARKAVAADPNSTTAHLLLGNALVGLSSVADPAAVVSLSPTGAQALARFVEAEAEYRKAIALEPDAPSPYVALGRLQEALTRRAEAEASYKQAIALKPSDVSGRRALARLYLADRRPKEAEVELRALASALNTPAGYLELADYFIALSRWSEAQSVLEPLLNRITTFAPARIRLAAVEFQSGRLDRAHELVDEVLEQLPSDTKALLLKARLLRSEGRIADAIVRARSAMDADPEAMVARLELASLYVIVHNRDEALRVLRTAPSVAADAAVQIELARLYLDRADPVRARAAAERALAVNAASAAAKALLVRSLVSAGDLPAAVTAFKTIPAGAETSLDVLVARGDLEAANRAKAAARREYQRALAEDPNDTAALAGIVRVEIADRGFAAARSRVATNTGARSPLSGSHRRHLGAVISVAEGDLAGAERQLRALVADEPLAADSWMLLAEVRQRMGQLVEAQSAAAQAVQLQPGWPAATLLLGTILEAQGNAAEAQRRYEQLLKVDADSADVRKRLGR